MVLQNNAKSLRDNWHLDRKGKGVVLERTRIYVLKLLHGLNCGGLKIDVES